MPLTLKIEAAPSFLFFKVERNEAGGVLPIFTIEIGLEVAVGVTTLGGIFGPRFVSMFIMLPVLFD